ncbi:hypothetical protein BJ875DRAFT_475964 [Amylocarpus encephaloides]|uniref:Hint domain-containing protein n=1 Tax=Amylocarpus encephaloides TaxID=45428 RepID=A0A9P7Y8E2_9HELO|nr:hypothetical protein BJ875DRAFT_475964 [Amylocarpus encephaloides]
MVRADPPIVTFPDEWLASLQGQFPQDVIDYFDKSLPASPAFTPDTHIVRLLADFLISKENYTFGGRAAKSQFFSDHEILFNKPPLSALPGWDTHRVFLIVQAMHATGQTNVKTDNFDSLGSKVDEKFEAEKVALFEKFLLHQSDDIEPSSSKAANYRQIFLGPYRTITESKLQDGGGFIVSPSYEMWHRLIAYRAIGAEPELVVSAYVEFTQPSSESGGITEQTFLDIGISSGLSTEDNMKKLDNFEAWLDAKPDTVNGNMIGYNAANDMPDEMPIDYLTVKNFFEPDPSSGQCLDGETTVVMKRGSTKKMRDIKAGDFVMSCDYITGVQKAARVSFVHVIQLDPEVPLYEMTNHPGVLFTGSHPLINRVKGSPPEVTFVDMDNAVAMYPWWESLPTSKLEDVRLVPSEGREVYNFILDRDSKETVMGPTTFFVKDSLNVEFEVACDGPILEWFPECAEFFEGCKDFILAQGMDSIKTLRSAVYRKQRKSGPGIQDILQYAIKQTWNDPAKGKKSTSLLSALGIPDISFWNISIAKLLLGIDQKYIELATEAIREVVLVMGRLISDMIHIAWISESNDIDEAQKKPFLIIHSLHGKKCDSMLESQWLDTLKIRVFQQGNVISEETLPVSREGWLTANMQVAIPLDLPADVIASHDVELRVSGQRKGLIFSMAGSMGTLTWGNPTSVEVTGTSLLIGSFNDKKCVMRVTPVLLDPAVVETWKGGRSWTLEKRMEFARNLGEQAGSLTSGEEKRVRAGKGESKIPISRGIGNPIPKVVG